MSKKKFIYSEREDNLKSFFTLASESAERKLISSQQNSALCKIVSSLHDQFHYQIKFKNKNIEIFFSPSIENVTGYNPQEICDKNQFFRDLIIEEDAPGIKKKISLFENNSGENAELLYRIKRKDGEIVWLKEQFLFNQDKNGTKIFIGLVSDVTQFRLREESFKEEFEKLQNQIRARDNFLSILSHDLRAPFSSILGFTEILLSDAILTEAERTEYLNYINDSSSNQLRLVNYLLDWSNLQTGRLHIEQHRVQAQGLVFNCISALTGNAMRKNIEIKVNVSESIFIEVDERLMTQVITNLVSNAIKFSEDNRTISISAQRFNNELVEFVIIDQGVGIPENYQTRIFKFDKMFSTRGTRGERGTGLGLSLVKEIIERHKGNIWFYSKENYGSEFHFTVPSSDNTILIVENNKKDYSKLQDLIIENYPEFKFLGAENGFEAINLVLKQHPSLIISAHDLPLMNGVQFVKSILRGDKKFYAPIIVMVDSTDDISIKNYKEIGINSILYKPLDLKLLDREITHALN